VRFEGFGEGTEGGDVVCAGPEGGGVLSEGTGGEVKEGQRGGGRSEGERGWRGGKRERTHLSELCFLSGLTEVVPESLKDGFFVVWRIVRKVRISVREERGEATTREMNGEGERADLLVILQANFCNCSILKSRS